ncbi:diguanylate cyclase, partial [Pseudoalteromonas sp. SG41-6]
GGYLPTSNMAEVANFTQQLISLAQTIHIKNNRFLTVSIGVALQKNDELLDQVMKRADLALYAAKKNGRNRVEIHS